MGDHNEGIMNALAERSNGRFYHLVNLGEVKSVLEGEKPKLSGGIKVKYLLPLRSFSLLFFSFFSCFFLSLA